MSNKERKLLKRITTNPGTCHDKPVIRDLRYPVESLLQLLSSGMTSEEILEDYKDLQKEDILAALSFAYNLTKTKSFYSLSPFLNK
jgi:uncharacterized protein (DUF433 family)